MPIFRATHVLDEVPQLVRQSCEDLVFIFYGLCSAVSTNTRELAGVSHLKPTVEKGYQLVARPLRTKRQRDCGQPPNGIQPKQDVVVLH